MIWRCCGGVVLAAGLVLAVAGGRPALCSGQDGEAVPVLVGTAITIDGQAADWQAIEPVVTDDDSGGEDLPPAGGDLRSLRIAVDPEGRFVFWMIEVEEPPVAPGVLFHAVLRRDALTSLAEARVWQESGGPLHCEIGRYRLGADGLWRWWPLADDPGNCAVGEVVEGRFPAWMLENDGQVGIGPFEWSSRAVGDGGQRADHFRPPAGVAPDQWRFWRSLPLSTLAGELECAEGCAAGGRAHVVAASRLDFAAPAVARVELGATGAFSLTLPMGSRVYLLAFWDNDGDGALSEGDMVGYGRRPVAAGQEGVRLRLAQRAGGLPLALPATGDITADRSVDVADGIAALQVLAGNPSPFFDLAAWPDADGDQRWSVADVVRFFQELARPVAP